MNNKQNIKARIICPECDSPVPVTSDLNKGQIFECSTCGVEIEVVSVNPLTLSPLEEEK